MAGPATRLPGASRCRHFRRSSVSLRSTSPVNGKSASPKDGKFTMDLFARAVEAVRTELKADRFVLAGHSVGTPAIGEYARLYPERVIALIFVDGRVTFGPNGPSKFDRQQWLGEEGRKSRESMIGGMFGPATTDR